MHSLVCFAKLTAEALAPGYFLPKLWDCTQKSQKLSDQMQTIAAATYAAVVVALIATPVVYMRRIAYMHRNYIMNRPNFFGVMGVFFASFLTINLLTNYYPRLSQMQNICNICLGGRVTVL